MTISGSADERPGIALIIGGNDSIDDWLDSVGISLEVAIHEVDMGFAFGYAVALKRAGIRPVFFAYSRYVRSPTGLKRKPCGTGFHIFPPPRRYAVVGRKYDLPDPKPRPVSWSRAAASFRWHLGSYLAADFGNLATTIREERCSGLICQDYESPQFDIATVLARRYGLLAFGNYQGGFQMSRFETPLRRRTIRAAAGLIIPQKAELQRVQTRYGMQPDKLAHIPNPIDVTAWREGDRLAARAALDIPAEAGVVVYHGRIEMHDKGLDVLLTAWDALCQARPRQDLRLLLVGSGTDAPQLRDLLRSGRLRGVHWTDRYIPRSSELKPYLHAADVYAFASRHEGQPVALIEAMACGLPIVSTAVSGVADLLGYGDSARGITVAIGDARSLAHAIGGLLDNPQLRSGFGSRAHRWVESRYDVDVVGRQLRRFMVSRGLRIHQAGE